MRNSTRLTGPLLALLLATGFNASADNTKGPALSEIREQQQELREEVTKGKGIFQAMNNPERASLTSRQDELLAIIEGKDAVQDLDDASQVRAFNLLQEINGLINGIEDERIVCEYIRKTGSHRKVKHCATVAERRADREAAQLHLGEALKRFCGGTSCS